MVKRSFIIIAALVLAAATAGCAAGPQEYVTVLAPAAAQANETAAPVESTPMSTLTAEPTSEPTPEPTPAVQKAIVGFVGDILMMTRQIADAKTETGYDFTESFLPMKSVFESVDIMCADFEGTFGGEEAGYTQPRETIAPATEENPNPTNPPMQSFSAPDELAKNLFDAGIDAVTTANNHAMDRDDAGLFRTINVLRAAGIKTAGTALSMEDFLTPCVIKKNGIKIGLVGATQILNGTAPKIDAENRDFALTRLTEEMVKSQISACTGAGAEFIIIMVHWGYEHQSTENESQRRFAAKLIDWGADAIIGAHGMDRRGTGRQGDKGAGGIFAWELHIQHVPGIRQNRCICADKDNQGRKRGKVRRACVPAAVLLQGGTCGGRKGRAQDAAMLY